MAGMAYLLCRVTEMRRHESFHRRGRAVWRIKVVGHHVADQAVLPTRGQCPIGNYVVLAQNRLRHRHRRLFPTQPPRHHGLIGNAIAPRSLPRTGC